MTSILKVSSIQDPTNSNTALSIDTSGRVTLGTPVFGHFYTSGSPAGLGAVSTLVKLPLDSTYHESGGFTVSNNEVTVPMTGRYRWSVTIGLDNSSARRAVSLALYKDGNIDVENTFNHFAFPYVSGTTHNTLAVSNIINCTAGQDVSLYLREYDNNNMTVRINHFTMDFIG